MCDIIYVLLLNENTTKISLYYKKTHLNNKVLEIFYYFHHFSQAPYFHKNIISGGLMDLQLYTNQ